MGHPKTTLFINAVFDTAKTIFHLNVAANLRQHFGIEMGAWRKLLAKKTEGKKFRETDL
jgi:hypothetical protein